MKILSNRILCSSTKFMELSLVKSKFQILGISRNGIACIKLLLVLLCLIGCERIDTMIEEIRVTREKTLFSLDEAITSIQNAPADWSIVLNDLEKKMATDIQETIREDVQILINRSAGEFSSGVVCIMDAIPGRIIHSLETIRIKLVGGEISKFPPTICTTSHNTIDLNLEKAKRDEITFHGYDFDHREGFEFHLTRLNGANMDLSHEAAFQADYKFTIDLSSFSDELLGTYKSLTVSYEGVEISRINIQKIDDSDPETQTVYITPTPFTYMPPHTRGDREFDGNGPRVRISNYFYNTARHVYLQVNMIAEETKADWTTAEGRSNRHYFYTAPDGWHIKEVSSVKSFPNILEYTDDDTAEDCFNKSIGQICVIGDTHGDEAGTRTRVNINYNYKVAIVIQKD